MNTKNIVVAGLLALAGVVSANAAVTTSVGDLILGFKADGGQGAALNLEVNLGSMTNFLAIKGTGQSLNLSSTFAMSDLVSTYGANWGTRTDVTWGAVAGSAKSPSSTVLNGIPYKSTIWETSVGQPAISGISSQNNGLTNILGVRSNLNGATSAGTANSAIVDATASVNWSGQSLASGTFNYGQLSTLANPGSTLSFYELIPSTAGGDATLLGTFSLTSAGDLTFTAVPEPSTYAMILGAMTLGFVAVRRRLVKQA